MNSATRYDGLKEMELLEMTLREAAGTDEQRMYLVENLADANGNCSQGRAARLIDCMALAQSIPIVPEALIKKELMANL